MKRLIKFRGKRTDTGEWVFGNLVMIRNGDAGKYYPCIVISYNHDTFDWIEVIPDTVGQFTGLLDKNKREVYEGDIIRDTDGRIGKICWDEGYLQWFTLYNSGESDCCASWYPCEVIGNVFDNPKLLKGGKE